MRRGGDAMADDDDHSFSLDDLLKELEDNDWWKSCVQCFNCPVFTKNCSFKKYSSRRKYFCTCSFRSKGQKP